MDVETQKPRDYRFAMGLLAGAAVGAGLTMWFAPHAATELRRRIADSTKNLSKQASDELTRRTQGFRENVADAVARGAHEVERQAAVIGTDRRT